MNAQANPGVEFITVQEALERATGKLDRATNELHSAEVAYTKAVKAWELVYDSTALTLEAEYTKAGRKSSPAEHTITATTRRSNRELWDAMKQAKRRMENAQTASQNRRQQSSAYQTMMNNLGHEALVQDYLSQRDES